MRLEIHCILYSKVVRVSQSQVWHTDSFVVVFHARNLESDILVFIFLCTLIYQMMRVGIFQLLNGVLYTDDGYLVIVNTVCCSLPQRRWF